MFYFRSGGCNSQALFSHFEFTLKFVVYVNLYVQMIPKEIYSNGSIQIIVYLKQRSTGVSGSPLELTVSKYDTGANHNGKKTIFKDLTTVLYWYHFMISQI